MMAAHALIVAVVLANCGSTFADTPGQTAEQTPKVAGSEASQAVAKAQTGESETGRSEERKDEAAKPDKASDKDAEAQEGGKDTAKQDDAKKPEQAGDKDGKAADAGKSAEGKSDAATSDKASYKGSEGGKEAGKQDDAKKPEQAGDKDGKDSDAGKSAEGKSDAAKPDKASDKGSKGGKEAGKQDDAKKPEMSGDKDGRATDAGKSAEGKSDAAKPDKASDKGDKASAGGKDAGKKDEAKQSGDKGGKASEAGKSSEDKKSEAAKPDRTSGEGAKPAEGGKDAGKQEAGKEPEQTGDIPFHAAEAIAHVLAQCFTQNATYHPIDMLGHPPNSEDSAALCQARCARIADCKHFTYVEGTCHVTDSTYLVKDQLGFTAGPQKCDPERADVESPADCFIADASYVPLDMVGAPPTVEPDVYHCQARCAMRDGCLHFTFNKDSGECHVTDGRVLSRAGFGTIAGHPNCSPQCFHENAAYLPLNMKHEPESVVESVAACQERCVNTPGCKHFTFLRGTRVCHITDGTVLWKNWAGATAGPSACEFENTDSVIFRRYAGTPSFFGVPSPGVSVAFTALALAAVAMAVVAVVAGLRKRGASSAGPLVRHRGSADYVACLLESAAQHREVP